MFKLFDHKIRLKLPLVRPISEYLFHPIRSSKGLKHFQNAFQTSYKVKKKVDKVAVLFKGS